MDDDYYKLGEIAAGDVTIDSLFQEDCYVSPQEITFCNYMHNRQQYDDEREEMGKMENVILFPVDYHHYSLQYIASQQSDYLMVDEKKTYNNVLEFEKIGD